MGNTTRSSVVSIQDDQMIQIPKDYFFDGMPLPAPIYVRMTAGNYLIIGKKGDKSNFSSLHGFKNPNFLIFVTVQDHPFIMQHLTQMGERIVSQKGVPAQIKSKFLSHLTEQAVSEFEGKGFTSTAQLQKVSKMIIEFTQNSETFNDILKILEELPANESKHSILVGMVAMVIAEEMQISHGVAHEKIAMASLLHDVGLKSVPRAILEKPRHLWTPEELSIYEQHPIRGAEMLRDVRDLPSDVLLMIVEHHENAQGTGFPKRIRDIKVSPLGRILVVANYFANLLFTETEGAKSYTADEAVTYIETIVGQPFNRQVFTALKNAINKQYMSDQAGKKASGE